MEHSNFKIFSQDHCSCCTSLSIDKATVVATINVREWHLTFPFPAIPIPMHISSCDVIETLNHILLTVTGALRMRYEVAGRFGGKIQLKQTNKQPKQIKSIFFIHHMEHTSASVQNREKG